MRSRGTAEGRKVAPGNGVSLLRVSMSARLGLAAVATGLLWLCVLWALA